jgi:hypothetical protein
VDLAAEILRFLSLNLLSHLLHPSESDLFETIVSIRRQQLVCNENIYFLSSREVLVDTFNSPNLHQQVLDYLPLASYLHRVLGRVLFDPLKHPFVVLRRLQYLRIVLQMLKEALRTYHYNRAEQSRCDFHPILLALPCLESAHELIQERDQNIAGVQCDKESQNLLLLQKTIHEPRYKERVVVIGRKTVGI